MEAFKLMQCIIMENTLIKLPIHDETKKRAHDSQIVRAKENLKLSQILVRDWKKYFNVTLLLHLSPPVA